MDIYYDKKYKKNALVRVFVRVDFENYLPDEVVVSESIEAVARKYFPNRQMEQVVKLKDQNASVVNDADGNSYESQYAEGVQREYRSENEKNKVPNKSIF